MEAASDSLVGPFASRRCQGRVPQIAMVGIRQGLLSVVPMSVSQPTDGARTEERRRASFSSARGFLQLRTCAARSFVQYPLTIKADVEVSESGGPGDGRMLSQFMGDQRVGQGRIRRTRSVQPRHSGSRI